MTSPTTAAPSGPAGVHNLDRLAAQHAQAVIAGARTQHEQPKDIDNAATKALGILQENGIYAATLFLLSRPQREQVRSRLLLAAMLDVLQDLPFGWQRPAKLETAAVLNFLVTDVTRGDNPAALERLILAKDTLEQMLIYTRYSAKAWGHDGPPAAPPAGGA